MGCIPCWSVNIITTEVGYWVGKPYWGQGVASEALSLYLQRRDFPKTPRIIAKVVKQNLGSQRVLLKNGFVATDTCEVLRNGHTLDAVYFVRELSIKS
jgi:RimJ/RimL family protein N-acetyltransferase